MWVNSRGSPSRGTRREEFLVDRIFAETPENLGFAAGDAEFHRVVAEHGDQHLLFDGLQTRMRPHQGVVVGRVHECERVAPIGVAGRTHGSTARFGEGEFRAVAGGACLRAVAR